MRGREKGRTAGNDSLHADHLPELVTLKRPRRRVVLSERSLEPHVERLLLERFSQSRIRRVDRHVLECGVSSREPSCRLLEEAVDIGA
jgi:hypothetical protein